MKLELASKFKAILDGTTGVLKTVNQFDSWPADKQKEFIDEAFYEQVKYCRLKVPYYTELFAEHGIHENKHTDITTIGSIPILTKDIIRKNYDKLKSVEIDSIPHLTRRSGGTTGEPIRAYISREAAAYETFSYFKGLRWMGWKPEMKMVKLFGGSLGLGKKQSLRSKVYSYASNSLAIPAFEIDKTTIRHYHEMIKKCKTVCMIGYASALNNFVLELKVAGLSLSNVNLVVTTSEQLAADWKHNIETVLKCPVRSYYGCGEVESLGYQTTDDGSYKIPMENAYIESSEGNKGLIITQLHNKAQPFLRFTNGDLGELKGSPYPTHITNLIGRSADVFYRKDGTSVSPIFGTYSIQKSEIKAKQYQYVQYSDKQIEFRYQMEDADLNSEEKAIIEKIVSGVMNEPTQLIFTNTDKFEVSASNKHRICVRIDRAFK